MTKIPNIKYKEVGGIYGIRAWIEYGFKQCKSELGWSDFRFTHHEQIEKWWELIMCAYLMVCLYEENLNPTLNPVPKQHENHIEWTQEGGWKTKLNNLRLVIHILDTINFLKKWLKVFPLANLLNELMKLFNKINKLDRLKYLVNSWDLFCHSPP